MDLSSTFNIVAMVVGGGFTLAALTSSIYTVKQRTEALITQFGKHVKTVKEPGLKFKIPFIQKVEAVVSTEEIQVTEPLTTKTKDDLFVDLPIAIHFEVSNSAVYYFDKGDAVKLMGKVVSAAVREYTSQKTFQELYNERQEIKDGVMSKVEDKVKAFGITINDIVIDEPQASDEVKQQFDRVRSSALETEAIKNEAKQKKMLIIAGAEADRQRDILRGQGAAGYRKEIFDQYAQQIEELVKNGTPREEAVSVMMKIMELDTWREVGAEGNMVIVTGGESGESREFADLTKRLAALDVPASSRKKTTSSRRKAPAAPKPS